MFTVYTKKEQHCPYCEKVLQFLDDRQEPYIEYKVTSEELQKVCKDLKIRKLTFPQVFRDGQHIGTYESTVETVSEPILQKSTNYTLFPIEHHDVFDLYRKAVASFWVTEEIDLSKDLFDWDRMTADERHFIGHVLAFFAGSDGIVNENLATRFYNEVGIQEAKSFYAYQIYNESIHSHTYSLLIDTYIKDAREKDNLFNAIYTIPSVQKKAEWCQAWILDTSQPFSKRLIAFALVEGVFFSGSFCAIFWLKKRGIMPGLSFSNELISRDEGLHQDHAVMLFHKLEHKPSQETVHEMFRDAVAHEIEFICESIPCRLIGMNSDSMSCYIRYVANRLLLQLGYAKIWNVENPFPFMETIALEGKTNFFERKVGEYQKIVKGGARSIQFGSDVDF